MRYLYLIAVLFVLSSCEPVEEPQKYDVLITNANIVDVTSGIILQNKVIAINDEVIQLVQDQEDASDITAREIVDAANGYVMPGLWDMHVHFRGGDSLKAENRELLSLFLVHGITTVRDAGGDLTPAILEWRNSIRMKSLDGPTIFTSGPKIDGPDPAWPGSLSVAGPEDVEPAFDSLVSLGVDYVKTYDGSLSDDNYYAVIREAEERDLKITGHMPSSANLMQAIREGLDGTEHSFDVIMAISSEVDSIITTNQGLMATMKLALASYDSARADSVFGMMEVNEVYYTPTLYIYTIMADLAGKDHSADSLLKYIAPAVRETYNMRVEGAVRNPGTGDFYRDIFQRTSDLLAPMVRSGVLVLAGSDSGPYNSFNYPGASLLQELETMESAGLTPREALATSVINGPSFFSKEKYYGSIETGKFADIIITRLNPLETVKNLNSLETVIHKGKLYPRDSLDGLLPQPR